jgi:hypothetical protein
MATRQYVFVSLAKTPTSLEFSNFPIGQYKVKTFFICSPYLCSYSHDCSGEFVPSLVRLCCEESAASATAVGGGVYMVGDEIDCGRSRVRLTAKSLTTIYSLCD